MSAEHTIEQISFAAGTVTCSCGEELVARDGGFDLVQTWDSHRGIGVAAPTVHRAAKMATDAEVREFFDMISDPNWKPNVTRFIDGRFRS